MPLVPVSTTWFDDDEELTEIETDEEDEPPSQPRAPEPAPAPAPLPPLTTQPAKSTRPTTQNATQKSMGRSGTRSVVALLRPPRMMTYSVSGLFDLIQQQLIDLNPEYQRGVVWNDKKQSDLINSIFSNYYVPPVVFTVDRQSDGREMRVCIDGKQRLTSIYRFFLGEIAYKDSQTNRKSYYINPPSVRRKLLTTAMQMNFRNRQFSCVEYEDLTQEQEREIFQRVQLGVALAPADRLPAINGPCADMVRTLRKRIEKKQGFEFYFDWGKARGKDFQALAQIVYLIAHGHQPTKAEPTTMRIETFLGNHITETGLNTLQQDTTNTMDIYCRIVADHELGQPLKKMLTPLEFVMASYLVFLHRKKLSDSQLSDAMARMRLNFKTRCPDMKYTTKNFKFMLAFVQKEVPKLLPRLRRVETSNTPAFEVQVSSLERKMAAAAAATATTAPPAEKRKKRVTPKQDSDSGSEFSLPLKVSVKRKRNAVTESNDNDSDCIIIPKKKKVPAIKPDGVEGIHKAEQTKPKLLFTSGARGSAKTVVKRSSTAKPSASSSAPQASPSQTKPSTSNANTSTSNANAKASGSRLAAKPAVSATAFPPAAKAKPATIQSQVGKPSVRPLPSARTTSTSSVAGSSQMPAMTNDSLSLATLAPTAISIPSPHVSTLPPLPTAQSGSMSSPTNRLPLPTRVAGRPPSMTAPETVASMASGERVAATSQVQEVSRNVNFPPALASASEFLSADTLPLPFQSSSQLHSKPPPSSAPCSYATEVNQTTTTSHLNGDIMMASSMSTAGGGGATAGSGIWPRSSLPKITSAKPGFEA